jgi:hypothetical protein
MPVPKKCREMPIFISIESINSIMSILIVEVEYVKEGNESTNNNDECLIFAKAKVVESKKQAMIFIKIRQRQIH